MESYIKEQVDESIEDLFHTVFEHFKCSGDITPHQSQVLDYAKYNIENILKKCVKNNAKLNNDKKIKRN